MIFGPEIAKSLEKMYALKTCAHNACAHNACAHNACAHNACALNKCAFNACAQNTCAHNTCAALKMHALFMRVSLLITVIDNVNCGVNFGSFNGDRCSAIDVNLNLLIQLQL